jgi:membrane-bound lytic murein transglycosylase B
MSRSSGPRTLTVVGPLLLALLLLVSCASTAPRPAAAAAKAKSKPAAVAAQRAPQPVASTPERSAQYRRPIYDADLMPTDPADLAEARRKGWSFMVEKLASDGVSRGRAAKAFADPRMPPFDGLLFGLNPREPHSMYRGFLRASSMASAERCAFVHADDLRDAERLHGVDASVVAAIMHVETHCGRNTGRDMVLWRLARLAMANEPKNVARNLSRYRDVDEELSERVRSRARYLEGIFYPQVVATFEITRQEGISPLALRGSGAGAFGYVQFLPMNYVAFGTDADGDGKISLYEPADAAASCARFLASYGWRPGIDFEKKRQVIWHYNRSDAYIDTVLALAAHIRRSGVVDPDPALRAAEARNVPIGTVGDTTPITRRP